MKGAEILVSGQFLINHDSHLSVDLFKPGIRGNQIPL